MPTPKAKGPTLVGAFVLRPATVRITYSDATPATRGGIYTLESTKVADEAWSVELASSGRTLGAIRRDNNGWSFMRLKDDRTLNTLLRTATTLDSLLEAL